MREMNRLLQTSDFNYIYGTTTSLGYTTRYVRLENLKECEDWMRRPKVKNGVEIGFDDKIISFRKNIKGKVIHCTESLF